MILEIKKFSITLVLFFVALYCAYYSHVYFFSLYKQEIDFGVFNLLYFLFLGVPLLVCERIRIKYKVNYMWAVPYYSVFCFMEWLAANAFLNFAYILGFSFSIMGAIFGVFYASTIYLCDLIEKQQDS